MKGAAADVVSGKFVSMQKGEGKKKLLYEKKKIGDQKGKQSGSG